MEHNFFLITFFKTICNQNAVSSTSSVHGRNSKNDSKQGGPNIAYTMGPSEQTFYTPELIVLQGQIFGQAVTGHTCVGYEIFRKQLTFGSF